MYSAFSFTLSYFSFSASRLMPFSNWIPHQLYIKCCLSLIEMSGKLGWRKRQVAVFECDKADELIVQQRLREDGPRIEAEKKRLALLVDLVERSAVRSNAKRSVSCIYFVTLTDSLTSAKTVHHRG